MAYIDDDLNPLDIADESVESLLDALSLDVVKRNIEQQIDGTISPNRNFLSVVIAKFNAIIENKVDPEEINEIKNEMLEFSSHLVAKICDRYRIGIDPVTDDSMEYLDILNNLYKFFVYDKGFYVKTFVLQYIIRNKRSIIESLEIDSKKTDITSNALRKRNLSNDDVAILSQINEVIDYVKDSVELGPLEFLDVIDDGDYVVNELIDYYTDNILCGDFTHQYVSEVIDERSSESALQIRNDIRIELSTQGGY